MAVSKNFFKLASLSVFEVLRLLVEKTWPLFLQKRELASFLLPPQ